MSGRISKKALRVLKFLTKSIAAITLTLGLTYGILNGGKIRNQLLRAYVGSKVYYVFVANSGGTGFAVKGKSGKTYVVTNDHVCDGTLDGTVELYDNSKKKVARVRIIERSATNDLCIVEAPKGVTGLSLGNEPEIGRPIYVIGHPRGSPISVVEGEFVGIDNVTTDSGIPGNLVQELCTRPKETIIYQDAKNQYGERIKVPHCISLEVGAYHTTAEVLPGSSGSPLVDEFGRVIGVIFSMDNESKEGYAVSFKALKRFLSKY